MSGASIQDRYGTEAEKEDDSRKLKTIWKFSPSAYENEKIVMLPYAQYSAVLNSGGYIGAYQQYKINSIYDPDLTAAGNQPLGRDTYAGIYNYYKVLETHIKVYVTECANVTSSVQDNTAYPSIHGWMADITANPPGSIDQWLMTSMAGDMNKQQKFGPLLKYEQVNGRGQRPLTLEYHWDASQFDTSIIDNTKNEWTAVGSDPANINYFSLLHFNPGPASGGSRRVVWHAELQYLVAFKQVNRALLNTVN
jgi:hypothetical protein